MYGPEEGPSIGVTVVILYFVFSLLLCFPLGGVVDLFCGSCCLLPHLWLICLIESYFKQPTPADLQIVLSRH